MAIKAKVKGLTKIQTPIVGSVMAGLALFGASIYAINMLPSNAFTNVIKDVFAVFRTR